MPFGRPKDDTEETSRPSRTDQGGNRLGLLLLIGLTVVGVVVARLILQAQELGYSRDQVLSWPALVVNHPLQGLGMLWNVISALVPGMWEYLIGLAVVGLTIFILARVGWRGVRWLVGRFGSGEERASIWAWNRIPARRKTARRVLGAIEHPRHWWRRWRYRQRHAERPPASDAAARADADAVGGPASDRTGHADPSQLDDTGGGPRATDGSGASVSTAGDNSAQVPVTRDGPADPATADSPATAATADAPRVQPFVTVPGPVMKELTGDTRAERTEGVRPGDKLYVRLRLTGTVDPTDLTSVFANRVRDEVHVFRPYLGGAPKPELLRERLPWPVRKLPGLGGDGHAMIEGLYVYWTDHDGNEHFDLLLRHTDGGKPLKTDVLEPAYQDVDLDWVSTSPLRILAGDAARTPFPDPTWDDGDDGIPAREAVADASLPDPPVIEAAVEAPNDLRRVLDLQRAANLPYVARQLPSRGLNPRDNMLSYARVPDPLADDTQAGDELQTGEFMIQAANRVADEAVRTPVGLSVYTCYYSKYKKYYEKKATEIREGETAEKQARSDEEKQEGDPAEELVGERMKRQELHGEEVGKYGNKIEQLKLNTAASHLLGMTAFDGGVQLRPSAAVEHAPEDGLAPTAASGTTPVCPPPGRTAVTVGHGAGELAQAAHAALSGDFYKVYTDPLEDLDTAYTGRQRMNQYLTLGDRLPGLGLPALTTERALTNLQKRWIRKPRWWGYKKNPTTYWPSHLTASEEVAVPFWPLDPDDTDALTDAARELVRTAVSRATEQEETEDGKTSDPQNDNWSPTVTEEDAANPDTAQGGSTDTGGDPSNPDDEEGPPATDEETSSPNDARWGAAASDDDTESRDRDDWGD